MNTCYTCDGEGEVFDCYDLVYDETYMQTCPSCNGRGEFDHESK
jgi:DnaJ-class molecular chaperone